MYLAILIDVLIYIPIIELSIQVRWQNVMSYVHVAIPRRHIDRGDYDYCRMPGTRQLSPLKVGEDNSYWNLKIKNNSNSSIIMVKPKVAIGVLRHAKSKSGI